MTYRMFLAILTALSLLGKPSVLLAIERQIADREQLLAALSEGVGGDILILAPGDYGELDLRGTQNTVPAVIRSADSNNPAVISNLYARSFKDLLLEDLHFRYRFNPDDPQNIRPFQFFDCSDLVIRSSQFEGDEAQGISQTADGRGYGIGLSVRGCFNTTLHELHISRFYRGIVLSESETIRVTKNELTDLRMDGINVAQVADIEISENYIHSFNRSTDPADHADMIQFWTGSTEWPSEKIIIRDNILNAGRGLYTQSIFMRNERADKVDGADRSLYYKDILIENNLIINAHAHGITVGETIGLEIRRNTLLQNLQSAGGNPTRPLWQPQIRVSEQSEDVTISNNITHDLVGYTSQGTWNVTDNLIVYTVGRFRDRVNVANVFEQPDTSRPVTWKLRRDLVAGDTGATIQLDAR